MIHVLRPSGLISRSDQALGPSGSDRHLPARDVELHQIATIEPLI